MSHERLFFRQSFRHQVAEGHVVEYRGGHFYNVNDEDRAAIPAEVAETEADHEARLAAESAPEVVEQRLDYEPAELPPGWPAPPAAAKADDATK